MLARGIAKVCVVTTRQRANAVIDAALGIIEDANLGERDALMPSERTQLLNILNVVLGPLPLQVVLAVHPVDLHGALLDWQGEILDALFPERRDHDEPPYRFVVDEPEPEREASPGAQ